MAAILGLVPALEEFLADKRPVYEKIINNPYVADTWDVVKDFYYDQDLKWKNIVLTVVIICYLWETYINFRQYLKLQEKKVPDSLTAVVKKEDFEKARLYSIDKTIYTFMSGFYSLVQTTALLYFDILPYLWDVSFNLLVKANLPTSQMFQSLVFASTLVALSTLTNLPSSFYYTFVVEARHGFNKQTIGLFITDKIKTLLLIIIIGMPFLAGIISIFEWGGKDFVFYVWGFFFSFQIFLNTIFPTVIQPMYNKFTPLEDGELKKKIEQLADKLKFPLDKVFVIDGSKRSSHSNAYFFGMFKTKRIVLYDTLLGNNTHEEILAILCHELGHWKHNHLWKRLSAIQIHTFMTFFIFGAVIHTKSFYQAFEFSATPTVAGFLLFMYLYSPVETIAVFLMNVLSRSHEFEADQHAKKYGYTKELKSALIKLNVKNLGNLNPDKLYSILNYSHPTLVERLNALGK